MAGSTFHIATAGFQAMRCFTTVRNSRFARLTPDDTLYFQRILSVEQVVTDTHALAPMNLCWMKKYQGQSMLGLEPKTTAQVSNILKYCHERQLAVVPQGGNTGLVGGGVPVFDEIIISTRRMSSVISFDAMAGVLVYVIDFFFHISGLYDERYQETYLHKTNPVSC